MSRKELANAIRALSMDAVQKANSGHPGAPMGMADIAEVLWNDFLKHNPNDPTWYDRDRFILSNGHGHSVNGKVTTRQIVLKRRRTLHTLGMAAVGVKAV